MIKDKTSKEKGDLDLDQLSFFADLQEEQLLEYESLYEDTPTDSDIPADGECRIIVSSRFKNDVEALKSQKRAKVKAIIKSLSGLSPTEIRDRLDTRNSKKFKDIYPATFKFRVTRSARIVYVYGSSANIDNELIKDSDIIFLAYVEIHDEQKDIALESRSELEQGKIRFEKIIEKVKAVVKNCYRDEIEFIHPLYFAATDLPILSSKQQGYIRVEPPVIIRGSAGSGKTILSLEFYRRLYKVVKSIVYITLTENMRRHASKLLVAMGIDEPQCYTFNEFSKKSNIITRVIEPRPERLVSISEKARRRCSNLTETNVYTYIRGVIKGGVLNGDRNNLSGLISFDEFKQFTKKEKLEEDEVREIYVAAEAYQARLDQLNRHDDNDCASALLKKPKIYDCIIVDEVQDLTEIQILALSQCCPSHKIFLFGDPNQVINPTVVDFGKIGGIFYRGRDGFSDVERKIPQYVLKETWRSGPHLIEYINRLTRLRQVFIGKQDSRDDADEKSMRQGVDESYWACYVTDSDVVEKVLDFANQSTECIIIVNDEMTETALEERLPDLTGRIFTVQEIKGLEYRDVIIYNIISDNEQYFLDMLAGEAKRSTFHRMVFNKYYVACTRAQDRIFICEDKRYDESVESKFFTEQQILPNNDFDALKNLVSETKNPEDWLKEAQHLKAEQRYKQSREAFKRAGDKKGERISQMYIDWQETFEMYNGIEFISEESVFAKEFFAVEEYEKSAELFGHMGDHHSELLALKCAGKPIAREDVRKAINSHPNFDEIMFLSICNSGYVDEGNDEIEKLLNEIKEL
ncbi:MAG: AAA family ATPase [Christensenellaceae bacterium]|jgi:hypothetical protein|nr:AAA family ATPase [Christensenellaceae bacterium]